MPSKPAHTFDIGTSLLASVAVLFRGTNSEPSKQQPPQLLELYEMENCPYCRLVREALTVLDLDALIYPCPKNGQRFRPAVTEKGGRVQFPFLVDPNTGTALYESADIIEYLYQTYGGRPAPSKLKTKTFDTGTSIMATSIRLNKGMRVKPAKANEHPLELWSFESSPFARPVRERLCELELSFITRNIGKAQLTDFSLPFMRPHIWKDYPHKGRNRSLLAERTGQVMSPYLADPNTGSEMFESADIIEYLDKTYGQQ